jgi:hypothetical protein
MATQFPVSLTFTEAFELTRSPTTSDLAAANLFHSSPNTGLARSLGVDPDDALVPSLLTPTNVYFQEIVARLRREGHHTEGTRWPLRMRWAESDVQMTATVRLMPPNVLVTTVKVRGYEVDELNLVAQLIGLQERRSRGAIPDLLRWTAAIVGAGSDGPGDETTFRKLPGGPLPATHLMVPNEDASTWAESHEQELLAVLIRDRNYRFSDRRLTKSLIKKNAELNLKGGARKWVDKQGALLVNSTSTPRRSLEFAHLVHMQILALAMQTLFGEYSRRRKEAPYSFDFVLDKALTWVKEPERVLRRSVSGQELWALLANELALSRDAKRLLSDRTVRERLANDREAFASIDEWWDEPNLEDQLASQISERPVEPPSERNLVQIINATHAQIAGRDINTFTSFDGLLDALTEAVDGVPNLEPATKDEALSLISRLRATAGTVATATAGGAGATIVGAALKQLLGLH